VPNSDNRELFSVVSVGNLLGNLISLGSLRGSGEFIIERKTEWQGDTEVEYIRKVTYTDSEVNYIVETRNIHHAR